MRMRNRGAEDGGAATKGELRHLLLTAIRKKDSRGFWLALSSGADVESKNAFKQSALAIAAANEHRWAASKLIERGADLNSQDVNGNVPLIHAAHYGSADVAKKLIEAGANVNLANREGKTPLMFAAQFGRYEIAEALLAAAGIDVNAKAAGEWTALRAAGTFGHVPMQELLRKHGAVE